MTAIEKLRLFAVATRPAFEEMTTVLQCMLAGVVILSCAALYAIWSSKLSFGGKSSREAAIRAQGE